MLCLINVTFSGFCMSQNGSCWFGVVEMSVVTCEVLGVAGYRSSGEGDVCLFRAGFRQVIVSFPVIGVRMFRPVSIMADFVCFSRIIIFRILSASMLSFLMRSNC